MDTRVALIAIIVEDPASVDKMNTILHEYREYIVGRMGIPLKERNLSLVSVAVDAPNNTISALTGKLGLIKGISAKAAYSKI